MLYRRGVESLTLYWYYARGNDRFRLYVHLSSIADSVFLIKHWNEICANCLSGDAHRCTVNKSSQRTCNDLKLILIQGRGAVRTTSSRSRRPSSSVPPGSIFFLI